METQKTEQIQENKMGTMPIPKLLVSMALPMVLSMLVQALYNVVDSIFVAKASEDGFKALSLAFPVQMLMIAMGAGTGVGINALLSRSLGEKKFEEANKAANNGLFLAFCSFLAFAVFGIFGSRLFFTSQTDNQAIIENGTWYVAICTIFSFGIMFQMTLEKLLQSTGKSFYSMITQLVGAVLNMILDPLLIFGMFGLPKLGVAGAAIATVIGQIVAMLLAVYFNVKKNTEIKLKLKGFRPDGRIIKSIYTVGVPAIAMQAIGSVMVFGMNKIFLAFSAEDIVMAEGAVFVFGAYFKVQSFIFMPVFGLNNGMIPILAYNYGARHKKRIMDTIKLSVITAICIMMVGLLLFQTSSGTLLKIFDATEEVVKIGVPAFRIISLSFIFAGFCIVILSVFQAFGSGFLSLLVSAVRQLVVLLPVAFLLSKLMGLSYVWFAFPVAEIVSVTLSVICLKYLYNKKIKNL